MLRKSKPNFQRYVKKIESQAKKNGFLIKKACHYMEQDSTKNRVVLVKTDGVSKYTLSVQKVLFTR